MKFSWLFSLYNHTVHAKLLVITAINLCPKVLKMENKKMHSKKLENYKKYLPISEWKKYKSCMELNCSCHHTITLPNTHFGVIEERTVLGYFWTAHSKK